MTNLTKYAIIVAGGSGLRMGTEVPKQFLLLNGLPVLMHTIKKFRTSIPELIIKLVLPDSHQEYWKSLCEKFSFDDKLEIISGGNSRFQSVKNGLDSINIQEGLVAIHDGVRPFVSKDTLMKSFSVAEELGNAVVSVPLKDSLRVIEKSTNFAVERTDYRAIQTPQTFRLSFIKEAFKTTELPLFTDDASVLEHSGFKINLIEGSYTNIKITTPEDLEYGEYLLRKTFS